MSVVYSKNKEAKLAELEALRRRHADEERKLVREITKTEEEEEPKPSHAVRARSCAVRARGAAVRGRITEGGRIAAIDRPARINVRGGARHLEGLHEYQKEGVLWLRGRRSALLGDDYGCGKSAQALCALPDYKPKAIVISPTAVALSWEAEARRWRPDVNFTILEPSDPFREPGENEIIWRSWGSQPDSIDVPLNDVYLIGDEIHCAKSDDAIRSERFRRLGNRCGWVWGLTATPMLGDPEDLWGVILSLGLTGIFDHSKPKFVELCGGTPRFIWDKRMNRGRGGRRRIGFNWGEVSPEVKEMLKEIMLRRMADDVLDDLPETQEIDVPVPAPNDLRPMLDEAKRSAWEGIDQDDLPPFEKLSEAMSALARAKTKYFVELADSRASKAMPLLCFSAHVDPVIAVSKLKGAMCITGAEDMKERRRAVEAFQAGKIRILAMTIQTGGAGLNLQKAGGVIFCDRDYTPGMNGQALGRARRQGNVRSRVISWRLITDHPLDRHLSHVLDTKSRLISATVG